ncbi:hypothetical protein [Photobacterium damselae]|uniref:hypothetical protein n=1 Tax=Photobacterium damselae TaxID=38293 RepID=UPI001F3D90FC|nr:hypothetical protein [Photobacterium damselae]UKA04877.1 hypothetical protein IHC89_21780 [Photobacterium damselae subsp. damselae]
MTTKIEKCPTCGGDAVDRSDFWECCVDNASDMQTRLSQIKRAIRKYHLALDDGKDDDISANGALNDICDALDMHWVKGETTAWLSENPLLKHLYK